jgi:hypothetical protein
MKKISENKFALDHAAYLIQTLQKQGKIRCVCGGKDIKLKLGFLGAEITCLSCKAKKTLRASTYQDIEINKLLKEIIIGENNKILSFKPKEQPIYS